MEGRQVFGHRNTPCTFRVCDGSKKGGSNEVLAVMPKARFLVTAAMAEIGCQEI